MSQKTEKLFGSGISAIGIMSGTSLDGLDLAYCHFWHDKNWHFEIKKTICIVYNANWRKALSTAHLLSEEGIAQLDVKFGAYIAQQVNAFLKRTELPKPELICSHGHTVFHDPSNDYTLQIGSGAVISEKTNVNCISDFRSLDVSLGGQGAPLVPIGDELLFAKYDACLNLGGFSNISFREAKKRRAFDICPVNIALNQLAQLLGKPFDQSGVLARSGSIDPKLLLALDNLSVYKNIVRLSLAREWLQTDFLPLIETCTATAEDKLRTVTEHSAVQIAAVINAKILKGRVLVTGGGAKNLFLMQRIIALCKTEIIVPSTRIVDFKEALIFAFLGVLRWHKRTNVLCSVTGAKRDTSSGVVHLVEK